MLRVDLKIHLFLLISFVELNSSLYVVRMMVRNSTVPWPVKN